MPQHSETFEAMVVTQKDFTFYLSALSAKRIIALGRGIQEEHRGEGVLDKTLNPEQSRAIIEAIESSKFASEVQAIADAGYTEEIPFQRFIDRTRVKELAAYLLEEDALIPNATILSARSETEVIVATSGVTANVTLEWAGDYACNIIDGQHRIEALEYLISQGNKEFEDFMVPFTFLADYPFYLQAELFAIVNGKQKPVNRSRVYDLLGYRNYQLEDKERVYRGELAIDRFCHHIVRVLNESRVSPWKGRIKMRGAGKGVVSQAAFIDQLKLLVTPRTDSTRLTKLPLLFSFFRDGDLAGVSRACVLFFQGLKAQFPELWDTDEHLKSCLFGKTVGVGVCFQVFHDFLIKIGGPVFVTQESSRELWRNVPSQMVEQSPPAGGRGIQKEIYNRVMDAATEFKVAASDFESMREVLRREGALL